MDFKKEAKQKREFILKANQRIQQMQLEIQKLTQLILISEGEARVYEILIKEQETKKVDKNKEEKNKSDKKQDASVSLWKKKYEKNNWKD